MENFLICRFCSYMWHTMLHCQWWILLIYISNHFCWYSCHHAWEHKKESGKCLFYIISKLLLMGKNHNTEKWKSDISCYLCGGMSFNTRDPAATIAPLPIFIFPSIFALAPISAPSPTFGWRSPTSFPVPPKVTPCQNIFSVISMTLSQNAVS